MGATGRREGEGGGNGGGEPAVADEAGQGGHAQPVDLDGQPRRADAPPGGPFFDRCRGPFA
jgi:hypothetical protein